jgi:hypothetical protein
MLCSGGIPDSFFTAYAEIRPLHTDWRQAARLNARQRSGAAAGNR